MCSSATGKNTCSYMHVSVGAGGGANKYLAEGRAGATVETVVGPPRSEYIGDLWARTHAAR